MKIFLEHIRMRHNFYWELLGMLVMAAALGSFAALSVRNVYAQYVHADQQAAVNEQLRGKGELLQQQIDELRRNNDDLKLWTAKQEERIQQLQSESSTIKGVGTGVSLVLLGLQLLNFVFKQRGEGRRRTTDTP